MSDSHPSSSHYRTTAQLLMDLQVATNDLDLTPEEQRLLKWLAEWDQDTVARVISILSKARRGALEPPVPSWIARYL